ncbi:MAG: DUF255 domain-containing protein [Bacteroidales bacterium]|jgi:thioredoxin-related protein|nr:DUF255 domain-containing protein [Bacteroidales bacterium]
MKSKHFIIVALAGLAIVFCSIAKPKSTIPPTVQWTDIENAQEQIKQKANKNKLIFIDCYTDWCGWCKVMDNKTFSDTLIAKLMNYYFISVKFNAEQKSDVIFNGTTYKYQLRGNRGINLLSPVLQQNKLSYPSFVILNADLSHKDMIQGYIEKGEFEMIVVYLGEGYDTKISYEKFKEQYNTDIRPQILKKIE